MFRPKQFKIWLFTALLSGLLLASFRCSVRKHDNIFDPQSGIDTLDMKLELRSADSVICFSWYPHYQAEITGYHLFRKIGNQRTFTSLAVLPATQTRFCDSLVHYDISYAYYLRLIGISDESPPTSVLRTVPGPGQIWVLDRWNEYILKFSYDMRHELLSHYAIWIPQALALNSAKSLAVITYPLYHYIEVIDPATGALKEEVTSVRYPYACVFNRTENNFWITDTTGALYEFGLNGTLQLLDGKLSKPEEIAFDAQGRGVVLDAGQHALILYHSDGTRRGKITGFNGQRFGSLKFLTAGSQGRYFYFIASGDTCEILYRLSTLTDSLTRLYQESGLQVVRENPKDHTLWLAVNGTHKAKILQLSDDGLRLNTLSGFGYIEDFALNPVNGNLVIADPEAHRVLHLRSDGSKVGVYTKAPYPFKVYIE